MKDCRQDTYASGDAGSLAQRERLRGSSALLHGRALVMSENVAKLIAILATFSRTGHN